MNKKSIFLLIIFINVAVFSGIVFGVANPIDAENYPPNSTGIQNENINYTLAQSSLIGNGEFDSLTGSVGDTLYAVQGTSTPNTWDAYIPEDYDYGAVDITLTPQYYSKLQNYGTWGWVESDDGWVTGTATGGDHYNDYHIDATSWNMKLDDGGSHAIDVDDDFDDSHCGSPDENYADDPDECDDGDWYGSSVSSVAAGGGRQECYTDIWGTDAWAKIHVKIDVTIDFPVDPNWLCTRIKATIGMGSTYDDQQSDAILAAWGGKDSDARLEIERHGGETEIGEKKGTSRTTWDEAIGGSWTFRRENNRRFARADFDWDVPDYNLYTWSPSGNSGTFRFDFRAYAKSTGSSQLVLVQTVITEFDLEFYLTWNQGSGWFSGSSGKPLLQAQYWDGSAWSPSYTADTETGDIVLAEDYADRNNGNIRLTAVDDGDIDWVDVYVNNWKASAWGDTEWGAVQSDVTLEFWDGTAWVELGSTDWEISTPNLDAEDWYVPGDGIKFSFQASAYSSLPGINGVSWSYDIVYDSINFTESIETILGSGSHKFNQSSGRVIEETWEELKFYNTPYIENLELGITSIDDITQIQMGYSEDTPIYKVNTSDFSPVLWVGDQSNSITVFWDFNSAIPSINNYSIVDQSIEYKPTRFNISSDEANFSYLLIGKYNYSEYPTNLTIDEWESIELNLFDGTYYYKDVSTLGEGNYSYYYMVQNHAGNWRTTDKHNITVIPGGINVSFVQVDNYNYGDTGNKLIFNVNDSLGGDWWVKIDGFKVYSGTWTAPSERFERSLDGYSIGVHEIVVFANNSIGREGYNSTNFVVYTSPQWVSIPSNTTKGECTVQAYTIGWTALDDNPRNYTLTHNGTIVQTGTWTNLVFVYYTINTCLLEQNAYHIYRMEFQDYHNVSAIDYFSLYIYPVAPTISDEVGGLMYEDDDVGVYWEVSDDCLKNYTVHYKLSTTGWLLYYKANLSYGITTQTASVIIDGDDFLPHGSEIDVSFRCTVYDKNGNYDLDEINVTVVAHPPELTDQEDGFYYGDDPTAELKWNVFDNNLEKYWIEIKDKDSDKWETIKEGNLLGKGIEQEIILNLYKLELEQGIYDLVIYVQDTYGNIVNDTVEIENKGDQPAVAVDVAGLLAWGIIIGVAIFGLYAISKSDRWERYTEREKTYVIGGTIGVVAILLVVLAIFGIFPVVFTELEAWTQQVEQSLGPYGVLILVLGVAGSTIGGIALIYYLLKRREQI